MARIALFGGAFDPITTAHVLVVTQLLNSELVDQVWMVPSADRIDKRYYASSEQRLAMLKSVLSELFEFSPVRIEAAQIERKLGSGSYTVDLLKYLSSNHPEHSFSWVVGADLVSQIRNWHEGEWLVENANFIVLNRNRSHVSAIHSATGFKSLTYIQESVYCSISSSLVRSLIASGKCFAGMVPATVEKLIKKEKFYQN